MCARKAAQTFGVRVFAQGLTLVLTLALGSAFTLDAFGQIGGLGRRDTGRTGHNKDTGAGATNETSGNGRMTLMRYKAETKADTKSDLIGRVTFRNDKKKSVNLGVRSDFAVELGGKKFSGEDLEKILVPGLVADVSWGVDKADTKNRKYCFTVTPVLTEFDGTVEEYNAEEEMLTIVAIPRDNQGWPDEQLDKAAGEKSKSTKKIGQRRKLRIKAVADGSKIIDELDRTRALSDFEPEKKAFGKLLVGTKFSVASELTLVLPEEEKIAAGGTKTEDAGRKKEKLEIKGFGG